MSEDYKNEALPMAARIMALKKGDQFIVKTKAERFAAMTAKRELKDAKVLTLEIITRETDNGEYVVAAI